MKIEAWFDGACGPQNPGGHAGYGAMIVVDGVGAWSEHKYCGYGSLMSNNVAEYCGLIAILQKLADYAPSDVLIRGDSMLVVKQMTKRWKAKHGLYLEYCHRAKELLIKESAHHLSITFQWIPREQNEKCDELSKAACNV